VTNDIVYKTIINYTPTGMIPTKEMTPYVPIVPDEIIDDVLQAYDLGISMVHLHARDSTTGMPTYKADVYGRIIEGIRKHAPRLILCVSLSGRNFKKFEQRSEPLQLDGILKPDMGSLTLSSLNFNKHASINEPEMIMDLALELKDRRIKPELEVFDVGMVNYAYYLINKKAIKPPFYFNLILGNIACAQADPLHAGVILRELPEGSLWSMGGIGNFQLSMNAMSISIGGGVRVGLEDNIWLDRQRTKLARNIDLVKRIHLISEANERPIMPAEELRHLLNLEDGNGRYGARELPCHQLNIVGSVGRHGS
jgi:3-keto-5-aminohexanoate cleavage enzyme